MAVKGIFVSDAGALMERPGELNSVVLKEARGGATPLFALSAGMSSSDTTDTSVTWYEEGIMHSRCLVTAINTPLGNQITVEDASWLTENMIMMVESTGEYLIVLGVSGDVLTVQRGIGGTAKDPIVVGGDDVALQLIGTAFEEASERPTGIATSPYPRTNICQIFRRAWDISGTAKAVNYRFGPRKERNKATAAMCHAEDIERSLIWGKTHVGVVSNRPYRQMNGLLAQLRSNIFVSPSTGLNRRVLTDYVERLFSKNIQGQPNERITFCGNVSIRALNEIAWRYGDYHIQLRENEFGIKVSNFVTPFGDLTLMPHPLMNDSPVWSSDIYSFHPAAIETTWLRRTTHEEEGRNGGASDLRDAEAGVYTSELTCKYKLESTGAIMTGVSVDHYVPGA